VQSGAICQRLLASWGIFTAATVAIWFPNAIFVHSLGAHPLAGLLLCGLLTSEFQRLRRYGQLRLSEEQPTRSARAP